MIELRWEERPMIDPASVPAGVAISNPTRPVLQFRTFTKQVPIYTEFAIRYETDWTDWQDVPTVQWLPCVVKDTGGNDGK